MKTLHTLNALLIAVELFLCTGTLFGLHVTFGNGLGDILYFALLYVITLAHLVFTWEYRRANAGVLMGLLFWFSISSLLFSLKATVWRGSEYPWTNGHLFYSAENDPATIVTE